jgi:MFS superfamily sulfate permease-like transporter
MHGRGLNHVSFSTFQGIPAHPLFVHIPVMGIPLCALLVICYVVRPQWRHALRIPTALLIGFTAIATVIAAQSGEQLQHMISPENRSSSLVQQHVELGDQTKAIMLIFAVVALAYLALDWYLSRDDSDRTLPFSRSTATKAITILSLATILLAGITTVWDVRTGHAGAKATWHDAIEPAGSSQDNAAAPGARPS